MTERVYVGNAEADASANGGWLLGHFRTSSLPGRSVLLAKRGDYVVFHGLSHSWYAAEESVVVAIRWPSVPGYSTSPGAAEADG